LRQYCDSDAGTTSIVNLEVIGSSGGE